MRSFRPSGIFFLFFITIIIIIFILLLNFATRLWDNGLLNMYYYAAYYNVWGTRRDLEILHDSTDTVPVLFSVMVYELIIS